MMNNEVDCDEYVSTVLYLFEESGILEKDFLMGWRDGSTEIYGNLGMVAGFLFDRDVDSEFKDLAEKFLDTLDMSDSDSCGSEDDESEEDSIEADSDFSEAPAEETVCLNDFIYFISFHFISFLLLI